MSSQHCPNLSDAEVDWCAGWRFLICLACSGAPSLKTFTFWSDLKQHLTELTLGLHAQRGTENLQSLGLLPSLRRLSMYRPVADPSWRRYLSGEKLLLKLPHLVYLKVWDVKDGELVVSCPKLAEVWFSHTFQLRIKVEDADLRDLMLLHCDHLAFRSPETQLQQLKALSAAQCSALDRHIIQDVGHMPRLQHLHCTPFPAACMPREFPNTLRNATLFPLDWCHDLPEGLKKLPELSHFCFETNNKSWNMMRPWTEFLPTGSLKVVTLGSSKYKRQGNGTFEQTQ